MEFLKDFNITYENGCMIVEFIDNILEYEFISIDANNNIIFSGSGNDITRYTYTDTNGVLEWSS